MDLSVTIQWLISDSRQIYFTQMTFTATGVTPFVLHWCYATRITLLGQMLICFDLAIEPAVTCRWMLVLAISLYFIAGSLLNEAEATCAVGSLRLIAPHINVSCI